MASLTGPASSTLPRRRRVTFTQTQNQNSRTLSLLASKHTSSYAIHPIINQELICYNYKEVKALAEQLRLQAPAPRAVHLDTFKKHPHGGRFIALDFASHAKSKEAADMLEAANLQGTRHFTTTQIPNACTLACHKSAVVCGKRLPLTPALISDLTSNPT